MDRRMTIARMFSGSTGRQKTTVITAGGLEPYSGPWTQSEATHLLRRATFGPNIQEINKVVSQGLQNTIDELFQTQPLPDPPINNISTADPYVPIGETWIEAAYLADVNLRGYRLNSLNSWTVNTMLQGGLNIREKMTLFWHNHFVTSRVDVNDPKFQYVYITLLRSHATGNFRELTKKITIDPSMLRYLNGDQNTKTNPNENYARELLELFTIGKGPLVGPGDYTNYTEDDVIAMAKVLTGWVTTGFYTLNPDVKVGSEYRNNRHDLTTKILSHRFDNIAITNKGDQEYAHLIDIIFSKDECAFFIARKLYRWFVYYTIDDNIEQQVIAPMAQMILDHDYNIAPALQALLSSAHFYEDCVRGVMIKHPIDFMMSMLRQSGWSGPGNLNLQYRYWLLAAQTFPAMQMTYYDPPSVAGWKAWYQEPSFYQSWLNSVTLPVRANIVKTLVFNGFKVGNNPAAPLPLLAWIANMTNPHIPDDLIDGFVKLLFPRPISDTKKAYLKEVLLPGLPDYEWTIEYTDYLNNPGDINLANAVLNKLRNLVSTMMQMPEYQLS